VKHLILWLLLITLSLPFNGYTQSASELSQSEEILQEPPFSEIKSIWAHKSAGIVFDYLVRGVVVSFVRPILPGSGPNDACAGRVGVARGCKFFRVDVVHKEIFIILQSGYTYILPLEPMAYWIGKNGEARGLLEKTWKPDPGEYKCNTCSFEGWK